MKTNTEGFAQSAPEQAGNVSPVKPFCYKYRHHSMCGGTMLLDEPTYDGQEAIETIPLYRLPEGHCIVKVEGQVSVYEISFKCMVDRFLSWKLPEHFSPDAGISFKPTKPYSGDEYGNSWWPIGTNLFSADQAEEMLKHVLFGSQMNVPPPEISTDAVEAAGRCTACGEELI